MLKKLLLIFLLLTLPLASCAKPPMTSGGEGGCTFVDDLGREVSFSDTPHRVACLLGSFADLWMLAGGEVCATASDAFLDLALDPTDVVNLGGAHSPNLELLLSANPDFVIASASTASHLAMRETLERLCIPVAYFDIDNFDDYLRALEICTTLTSRPDLYQKNGIELKEGIDEVKNTYCKQNFTRSEKEILLLRTSSTGVKVKGSKGTILGEMLSDIGALNIADENGSLLESLSLEAILLEDPAHIFVVTMGSDTELALNAFYRMTEENVAWGSLTAVREGRVHIMDKTLFNQKPNARYLEAYETLLEKLLTK